MKVLNSAADGATSAPDRVVPLSRRDLIVGALRTAVACPALASCAYIDLRVPGGGGGGSDGVPFSVNDPAYAALQTVGGQACIAVGPIDLMLYRVDELEIIAFDKLCPHQGLEFGTCEDDSIAIQYDPASRELTCPWHRSVFDETGAVVSGPSERGVAIYPVTFDPTSGEGSIQFAGDGSGATGGA